MFYPVKHKGIIQTFLVLFFFIFLLNAKTGNQDNVYKICEYRLFVYLMVWSVLSMLFKWFNARCELCIIILIMLWTGIEVITGYMQIYGHSQSNNLLFILTGSFKNPGPYAGFLTSCMCVLASWVLKEREKCNLLVSIIRYLCVIVTIFAFILIVSTHSRASILSLCTCLFFLSLTKKKHRSFLKKYKALFILIGLMGGILGFYVKKDSAIGRVMTDKISILTICKNVHKGAGLGHFPGAYANTQMDYFSNHINIKDGNLFIDESIVTERQHVGSPVYAFNDILQVGVEAGLITMLLYVFVVVYSFIKLYRKRSPFAYGLLSIVVFGFFSYPLFLWQFQFLLVIYMSSISLFDETQMRFPLIITSILSFVFICVNYKTMNNMRRMYNEWQTDRYFYNIKEYELYADYCNDKAGYLYFDNEYMLEYAYSLSEIGQVNKSDSILKEVQGTNNTPRALLLLGDNSVKLGNYYDAEQYYSQAFLMFPDRLTPLYKLAKLYYAQQDTLAFNNMARSIEQFHPRIESPSTDVLRFEIKQLKDNKY